MKPVWRRIVAVALVTMICVVYLPALGASFQYDDFLVIVRDTRVQSFAAWWASMPGMRPLLKLSYAFNHELGGGVRGFRLLNIAIHAVNAVLVLWLLERLSRRHGLGERAALGVAGIAALVFALHPTQTEAVTYISGRSSALSVLGALAALAAWLRGARWSAAVFFALAVATKEAAVVLPLAMLLWWATSPPAESPTNARAWRTALPLLLVGVALGAALLAIAPFRELLAESLVRRSPWQNLLVQSEALPYLAGQLLRLHGMNADPDLPLPAALTPLVAVRLAMLAGLVAGAIALRRRQGALAFGVLWFFIWLLPTHSLLPREDPANDRQLYLALVGPAWLLAFYGWQLLRRLHLRRGAVTALAAAMILMMSGALVEATWARNAAYQTEISFWEATAALSPRKARVLNNLGHAYALACRDTEARRMFERAAALDPGDFRPRVNLRLLERGALFPEGERHCS